jgi:hypothetical protein
MRISDDKLVPIFTPTDDRARLADSLELAAQSATQLPLVKRDRITGAFGGTRRAITRRPTRLVLKNVVHVFFLLFYSKFLFSRLRL